MPQHSNISGSTGFRRIRACALARITLAASILAACQQTRVPPGTPGAGVSEAPYPTLATVPPRPQLGYSLQQRRAIEGQLVGDREHAAYMDAVLDYETGRTSTPPPPPPAAAAQAELPPAASAPPPPRVRGPGDSPEVEAYVADALERDRDDGELTDFLRKLERRVPGAEKEASMAAAIGLGAEPSAGPSGLQRFGGFLGGLLGTERPAEPAPGGLVARLVFEPASENLPAGADGLLARALDQARAADAGLKITAGGGLGQARARAVAAALARLGAQPEQLDLAPGESGDEVHLTLTPRRGA